MLTKNAVGNLINRYRAVLDNCRLLNAFGALALATVLTANPAHATPAPDPITQYNDGTYSIDTGSEGKATFTVNGQAYYVLQKDQPITKTSNTAPLFIGNESTLNGGAISVATDGALGDITSYVFITNTALSEGGAVYTHGDLGDISSSTFIGNLADRGGALYNAWTTGDISSSTFIGNSAGRGGAIFNDGPLGTITDSTFTGNAAVYGGALYNNNTIPSIENSTFEGNSGRYDGGAIYNNDTITSITNSTFKGNKASTDGGAIWNRGTITSISNSTFENNESETNGGAIYNDGTITSISNSTFENNESETNGGAIYSTKPLNITNCSFWDNNAGDTYGGGAIYSEDSVTIIADGGVSEFSRNTGDGSDNGIHVEGAGIDFIMRNNGVFIMEDNVKADNITITSDGSGGSAFILLAPLNGDTTINNATIGIADDARFEKLIVNSGTNTVFSAAPPVPVALTAPSVPTPPPVLTDPSDSSDPSVPPFPSVSIGELQVEGGTLDASGVDLTIAAGKTFETKNGGTLIINANDMGTFYLSGGAYFETSDTATIEATLANEGTLVLKGINPSGASEWTTTAYTDYIAKLKAELASDTYENGGENIVTGGGLIAIDGLTLTDKFDLDSITSNVAIQDTVVEGELGNGADKKYTVSFAGIIPSEGSTEAYAKIYKGSTLTLTGANGVALISSGVVDNAGTLNLGDGTSKETLVFGGKLGSYGTTNVNGKTVFKDEVLFYNGGTANINAAGTTFEDEIGIAAGIVNVYAATTFDEVLLGGGGLNVQGSANAPSSATITSLTSRGGGVIFVQDAYTQVIDGLISGLLYGVASGGVLNSGAALNAADITGITKAMDLATTAVGNGFISAGNAILVHNTGTTLTINNSTRLFVGSDVTSGNPIYPANAYFGADSAFIVNTANLGTNAALAGDSATTISVEATAKLGLVGVKTGTYTILEDFAPSQSSGWAEGNVYALNALYKITDTLQEDGTYKVAVTVNNDSPILDGASGQFIKDVSEASGPNTDFVRNVLENQNIPVHEKGKAIEQATTVPSVTSTAYGFSAGTQNVITGQLGVTLAQAGNFGGSMFVDADLRTADTRNMTASADTLSDMPSTSYIIENSLGIHVWAMPFYQNNSTSGMKSASSSMDTENNFGGLVLGADKAFSDWRLGVAINAGAGSLTSTMSYQSTETDYDFFGANVYAGRSFGDFTFMAQLGYSHGDYDSEGSGLAQQKTDMTSHTYSASVRGSYDMATSFADVTPYLGLGFMHFTLDDCDLVGTGGYASRFRIETEDQSVWTVPFGVTLSKDFAHNGWTLTPAVDLGGIFAAGDLDTRSTTYSGMVSSMNTMAESVDAWTFDGGLSLGASKDVVDITLSYDVQVSEHMTSHGISAKIGYSF